MHFWQGADKFNDGTLKYQNKNVNKPGRKRKLSLLEEFLFSLGLKRVCFDVSVSLISKTFTTWINFLYHELPLYFPFPSQKLVRKYLPKSFEKYPTTKTIDGPEIFFERAAAIKTQAKHGPVINTIALGKTCWYFS